jgi:putative solute:sodium symporter small subunit
VTLWPAAGRETDVNIIKEECMSTQRDLKAYWKQNITYVLVLLSVWFVVSYLFGIIMADQLDSIRIAGFPLGFWFANQGSEVIFVVLIAVYVKLMNALDIKYDVHE